MHLHRNSLRYLHLLVAAQPAKYDIALLLTGTVAAIASGVPFPLIGILFGQLIDDFNAATCRSEPEGRDYQGDVNGRILIILYLAIAQFITIYVHLACWSLGGARLSQRLRERYFESLLQQEPSFFDNLTPGEVASRLNGDIQIIRSGTSEKVGICLSSLSFFVTAYVVAFMKDAKLAGMLVSLIPAYFIMSFVGSHYIEKYSELVSGHAASAASIASEALSNVLVVHAFGANGRLEAMFAKHLDLSRRDGIKKAIATGVQSGVMYFIAYAANGLAFWQGSRRIADAVHADDEGATVGQIFTVIFILIEATLILSQVAPFLHMFAAASASYQKISEDLAHHSKINIASEDGLHLQIDSVSLEFRNVTFSYPSRPEVDVLKDLQLSIPGKKHTAIVGMSGSGKSTISKLATRLYDPCQGHILLNGHDVGKLNTRSLRSFIGVVQQDPSLLDRSILENIAHGLVNSPKHAHLSPLLLGPQLGDLAQAIRDGKDMITEAELKDQRLAEIVRLVQTAASLADASTFIDSLRDKYGTIAGPAGRSLSGGQKQRISLARAIVKSPSILILDEATASLDSACEQRIQAALSAIAEDRTLLTIAHRLSTIRAADKIIVLKDGAVVEEGDHASLISQGGAYSRMVELQSMGTLEEETTTGSSDSVSHDKSLDDQPTQPSSANTSSLATFDPEETAASSKRTFWSTIHGLGSMARPYLLVVILALLGSSIVGGAFSAEAVIFGNTVGSLSPCKSEDSIRSRGDFFGLMFLILALVEFFANFVSWSAFGWVSEQILYKIRVLSFRTLFEQSLQWHQSENRTPAMLLAYITRDGNAIAGLSGSVIGTIFSITVNLIGAVILTHIVAWKIALVCLSVVPLLLGTGLMELRVLGKFEDKHENAFSKSVDIGVEAIASINTVASFALEKEVLETYRRSLSGPKLETTRVSLHASLWLALTYFLGNLVYALAYWWGSTQIISGTYSQTQFLIVVFSLLVSAQLWSQMFALAPELSSAKAAVARILDLVELGSTRGIKPSDHGTATEHHEKDIEAEAESKTCISKSVGAARVTFRDVTFAYPARSTVQVLQGLSVEFPSGKFCALVGPSGAGKSTIISLVEGMYRPQGGSILLDGRDIVSHVDTSFRDEISLVPQESVLFEGTIEFNVGLGARPGFEVTRADIEEACRLASIHDTIMRLPDGYETLCGPNGNQLSGGQKQRLSIARALVRRPRLLILDESTSALDAETEQLLQQGLGKATRDITVIAIAHRLHTIQNADIIFLIEGGRCVDRGTHTELFERSGSYRRNVLSQMIGQ